MLIDLTPPTLSHVADSLPCNISNATCAEHRQPDTDVISAGVLVQAWWYSAVDEHTDVVAYDVCVGSAAGKCDLVALTPYQPGVDGTNYTSHQFVLDAPLAHNATVCVGVEAVNEVGHRSDRLSSNCAVVDGTPPECVLLSSNSKPWPQLKQYPTLPNL